MSNCLENDYKRLQLEASNYFDDLQTQKQILLSHIKYKDVYDEFEMLIYILYAYIVSHELVYNASLDI